MNARIIALAVCGALLSGFGVHYWMLRNDLSNALVRNASLNAANQANLAAIEALVSDKARTEKALAAEAASRRATFAALVKIRKDIQNAETDPACLAADDRDRALAGGVRDMLAHHPD